MRLWFCFWAVVSPRPLSVRTSDYWPGAGRCVLTVQGFLRLDKTCRKRKNVIPCTGLCIVCHCCLDETVIEIAVTLSLITLRQWLHLYCLSHRKIKKNWNNLNYCCNYRYPHIWTMWIYCLGPFPNAVNMMANSVDPDPTASSVWSGSSLFV